MSEEIQEAPVSEQPKSQQPQLTPITTPEDARKADFEVPEQGVATPVADTALKAGERARAEAEGELAQPARDPQNPVTVRELFDAGVHFGHQTKRWNPKMRPFIYGARQGIHIMDLDQTATLAQRACQFVVDLVARGGNVLFVGTKRQAQDVVRSEAERSGMYYVTNRWLGGTLTNFRTMKLGLDRLRALERMREDGTYEQLLKKETVQLDKERARLEKYIGGMKGMSAVPQALFIIDTAQETIAVREARKLGIPIVAIADTNCDPDLIDWVIPGNDDAIRSIRLLTGAVADACVQGASRRRDSGRDSAKPDKGNEAQVIYSGRARA
jgi:small subunit ribosomal protein S2